jgi:hypothetical protein
MNHPFTFIHKWNRKPVFLALLAWTVVFFAIFQLLNAPLITSAAPYGIVSHQFAWTPDRAKAIISSWAGRPSLFAVFGLGLDFLFIPSYLFTVGLGALLAAGRHRNMAVWLRRLGLWATYAVFAAAAFDILENIFQARQLLNGVVTYPLTVLTGICACFKFGLLGFGILYGLFGWLMPKTR